MRVWILCGDKAGDNAQLRRVGRALEESLSAEVRTFELGRVAATSTPGLWRKPTYAILADKGVALREAQAEGPPDLVLASGRRIVPVLRQLRQDIGASLKLVLFGRPRAPLAWFDLVVTTPQYGLPEAPCVLPLDLPVTGVRESEIEEAVETWRPALRGERPVHAVLVGGNADPWVFDDQAMTGLSQGLARHAEAQDVDLVVTCGRRVPAAAAEVLRVLLDAEGRLRHFHRFDGDVAANPYRAYLGMAEAFIVSIDSVSMMAEAAETGRPLLLFSPSRRPSLLHRVAGGGLGLLRLLTPRGLRARAVAAGVIVPQRDTERIARGLVAAGRAAWLGTEAKATIHGERESAEAAIVSRIASLFTERGSRP